MLDDMLLFLGLVLGFGYLVLRGIRALDIGQGRPADLAVLSEEIEQLREQHQRLGNQITALRDGQDFARQLGMTRDVRSTPPGATPEAQSAGIVAEAHLARRPRTDEGAT